MPRITYAIERCGYADMRAFKLVLPGFGEPGFYRQAVSHSAFRSRELNRAFPPVKMDDGGWGTRIPKVGDLSPLYYSIQGQEDIDFHIHFVNKSLKDQDPNFVPREFGPGYLVVGGWHAVPVQEVHNVFEFYALIGYDYKKQKWLPHSEVVKFKDPVYRAEALEREQQQRKEFSVKEIKE